jgi:outer membrane lipoprotein carrier protein
VQEIGCDGEKVWIYDPELNQVTVNLLSKASGSSPAALLAGGKDIDRHFTIKDASRKGDLEWVLAVPKVGETGFERVFLGFKGDELMEMELHDSFGNRTAIEFINIERNPKFLRDLFKFTRPKDADLVGE